jgi:hypothetical protein
VATSKHDDTRGTAPRPFPRSFHTGPLWGTFAFYLLCVVGIALLGAYLTVLAPDSDYQRLGVLERRVNAVERVLELIAKADMIETEIAEMNRLLDAHERDHEEENDGQD